jgi:hypothetical protein
MRKMDLCALATMSTPIGNLRDLMAVVALTSSTLVATAQTVVPEASNSPGIGCPISPGEFNGWFVSGSVTPNGMVNPPDNVNFVPDPDPDKRDCSFYQQAAHMFLWVTSPPLFGYRGDSYVFDSSVFYEVSPGRADQPPVLVAKSFERPKIATVSVPKRGPDGGVVVFDDAGKMYGVVQVDRNSDIGSITIGADGMPDFLDKSGKPIKFPTLRDSDGKPIVFRMPPATIKVHGQLFFLAQSGKAIAAGVGQADRDKHVLMMQDTTQYNKLVYYLTQVNDVYAYFLTGTQNGKIMPTPKTFPSSQPDLKAVKRYAPGIPFPDENALIVELKSSWVELPYARDYADYVSIKAQVPDFAMVDNTHWKHKGTLRPATLAMVGMHIAFSVKDHPELIWATFEHVNNAPNVRYQYWDRGNFPSFAPWSFSSGGERTANQARMVMDGDDIVAINDKTIGPSDVLRVSPWGTYGAQFTPNRNTPVISTNNNVQGRLIHGDVRKTICLSAQLG